MFKRPTFIQFSISLAPSRSSALKSADGLLKRRKTVDCHFERALLCSASPYSWPVLVSSGEGRWHGQLGQLFSTIHSVVVRQRTEAQAIRSERGRLAGSKSKSKSKSKSSSSSGNLPLQSATSSVSLAMCLCVLTRKTDLPLWVPADQWRGREEADSLTQHSPASSLVASLQVAVVQMVCRHQWTQCTAAFSATPLTTTSKRQSPRNTGVRCSAGASLCDYQRPILISRVFFLSFKVSFVFLFVLLFQLNPISHLSITLSPWTLNWKVKTKRGHFMSILFGRKTINSI